VLFRRVDLSGENMIFQFEEFDHAVEQIGMGIEELQMGLEELADIELDSPTLTKYITTVRSALNQIVEANKQVDVVKEDIIKGL
tara:strand:+ start:915 stop:1166 length:252 start_codon:yes stop_codon:yes gene_type:complete